MNSKILLANMVVFVIYTASIALFISWAIDDFKKGRYFWFGIFITIVVYFLASMIRTFVFR